MKRMYRQMAWAVSIGMAVAVVAACGGGGGSDSNGGGSTVQVPYTGKTTQSQVSNASVTDSLNSANAFIPTCQASGTSKAVALASQGSAQVAEVIKAVQQLPQKRLAASSTQPPDQAGTCIGTPGKITYKNWNHASGTTTGVLSFADYCVKDSTTGIEETVSGDISFTNAGTPGSSGPITNKISADAPKITLKKKPLTGPTETTSFGFSGFEYIPGTPGSLATDAKPDSYKATLLVINNETAGKQMKMENVVIQMGSTKTTGSCQGFMGTTGFTDVVIDSANPLTVDSSGKLVSGKIKFSGSNSTGAVLTVDPVVSGSSFTVAVNGVPMAGTKLTCTSTTLP